MEQTVPKQRRNGARVASDERETTGTRLSTEEMDVLDGVIVTLCRSARNAARQAAKELMRPALFADFALIHITDHRESAPSTPEAPTPPPEPAQSP